MVRLLVMAGAFLLMAGSAQAETCIASHYGHGDGLQGSRTASGRRFDTNALMAAHRTRPFGSQVRVTNLANGRSVVVGIWDRGPWIKSRCIDLSWAAALAIGISGIGKVYVETMHD